MTHTHTHFLTKMHVCHAFLHYITWHYIALHLQTANMWSISELKWWSLHAAPLTTNGANPIGSMGRLYIYLHEWLIFMVNVGKYKSSHGSDINKKNTNNCHFQQPQLSHHLQSQIGVHACSLKCQGRNWNWERETKKHLISVLDHT